MRRIESVVAADGANGDVAGGQRLAGRGPEQQLLPCSSSGFPSNMRAGESGKGDENMAARALWLVFGLLLVIALGAAVSLFVGQLASAPREAVFTHRATEENVSRNSTYIDHPSLNGNPDAILVVTPHWNPEDSPGIYNDHPIGVWYSPTDRRWAIFNQDLAAMPVGAGFNVSSKPRPVP